MTEGIVSFEDWQKLDLRVGKVLDVEEIEGSDLLWKIGVDLGDLGKRTICAGIKKYYSKEELKGKKIIVFANLAPRKMRGIESQGMLLAADNEENGEVVLITPEKNIEVGTKIS